MCMCLYPCVCCGCLCVFAVFVGETWDRTMHSVAVSFNLYNRLKRTCFDQRENLNNPEQVHITVARNLRNWRQSTARQTTTRSAIPGFLQLVTIPSWLASFAGLGEKTCSGCCCLFRVGSTSRGEARYELLLYRGLNHRNRLCGGRNE